MYCKAFLFGVGLIAAAWGASDARADIFTVTGGTATCGAGNNCPAATTIGLNQSTATPFNFGVTATSGDHYYVSGTESASYSDAGGTNFIVNLGVTYTGATPAVTTDTFVVDVFQNFYDPRPGSWDGLYTETSGGVTIPAGEPAGSSFSVNLLYDGKAVGLLGPYTTPTNASTSNNLTGLDDDTLSADYRFSFTFAAGSVANPGINPTPTPEPRETIPLVCLGIVWAGFIKYRRRRTVVSSNHWGNAL